MAFADSLHYRTSHDILARPFVRLRSSFRLIAFEPGGVAGAAQSWTYALQSLETGNSGLIFTSFSLFLRDFFSPLLASSRRMNSIDEAWLSLLLVALFGLLLFLRIKFPNTSRGRETAVLLVATVLFFSICNFFLRSSAATVEKLSEPQTTMLLR